MPGREIKNSKNAIKKVISDLQLEDVKDVPIETLSKGFKRRVGIAQALIHNPKLLILDEPTDGLDPLQKFEVRKLIKKLSKTKQLLFQLIYWMKYQKFVTNVLLLIMDKRYLKERPIS